MFHTAIGVLPIPLLRRELRLAALTGRLNPDFLQAPR
jgi:hypothetical protein